VPRSQWRSTVPAAPEPASPGAAAGTAGALCVFGDRLLSCQKEMVLAAPGECFSWRTGEHYNGAFNTCSQGLRVAGLASEAFHPVASVKGNPQHLPFLKTNTLFF